jgi:hypothetical protein
LDEKNSQLTLLDLHTLGNEPVNFELHYCQQHLLALQKQMDAVVEAVIKEFLFLTAKQ